MTTAYKIVTESRYRDQKGYCGYCGIDEDLIQRACSKVKSGSNKHKLSGISQVVTATGNRMIVSQVLFSMCTRIRRYLYFCIIS